MSSFGALSASRRVGKLRGKKQKNTDSPVSVCVQNIVFPNSLSFYIILTTLFVDSLILK